MPNAEFAADKLSREADFFHEKLFGAPIPEELRQQYVLANRVLLEGTENVRMVRTELIVERTMDVEAIEFALRRRVPRNSLTTKLMIICYLAESRSDYFDIFVNETHRPLRAILEMSLYTLRSCYKLLKGNCLIRMYDVV
jgi:hypothetical protein